MRIGHAYDKSPLLFEPWRRALTWNGLLGHGVPDPAFTRLDGAELPEGTDALVVSAGQVTIVVQVEEWAMLLDEEELVSCTLTFDARPAARYFVHTWHQRPAGALIVDEDEARVVAGEPPPGLLDHRDFDALWTRDPCGQRP